MSQRGPQNLHPSRPRVLSPKEAGLLQKLQQARAMHQEGRFGEAEELYREVLTEAPSQPDALHFLGVLEFQRGNHDAALSLIDRAIASAPKNISAIYNRGNILREAGRLSEALASFDRVVALRPDHLGSLNNRGVILHELTRHEEAIASFDRAIAFRPDHADALVNRGNSLTEIGRNEEALASFARALGVAPGHAGALYGRGNALVALKRFEEAIASYDRALALSPNDARILNNRGNALSQINRLDEGLSSFNRAIGMKPDHVEALNNRGNTLIKLKRFAEADASFQQALLIRPDDADALYGRGYALTELKRLDEAIATFERLMAVRPDYPYAAGMLLHTKNTACDWHNRIGLISAAIDGVRRGQRIATPLAFLAVSDSAADNALCARILVDDKQPQPLWRGERYSHDRIRLAYVSADFHSHATAMLMAGIFERHDRARFQPIAVSFGRDDGSPMRARLENTFEPFIDVTAKNDAEVAALLREMEIDIAVDLKGYTADARPGIFAKRPAPIQPSYLGFPGTMGADFIDYIIADRIVIPETAQCHYSEKVVYLPDCYQANDAARPIGEAAPTRAEAGLPESGFVFCCFNNSYKIAPDEFGIWMKLLAAVEGSVLWLIAENPAMTRNLKREAQTRGVDPERIVFAPRCPPDEHLSRHRLADLFLDTLPYNAHTTASDALWAGLPIVTCLGGTFAGRVAGSLLQAIGLPQLVTDTLGAYEALALNLARDPVRLRAIKTTLTKNRDTSALFDTARFARHLEAAYVHMYERHRRGLPPESFALAVAAVP